MIGGRRAAFVGGISDAQRYSLGSLLIVTTLSLGFLPLAVDMIYQIRYAQYTLHARHTLTRTIIYRKIRNVKF